MQQFLPVRVKVRRHRVASVAKAIVKSVPSRGVPIYSSECFYDGKKSNSLQFFTPILSLRFLSSLFLLNTMGGGNGQKSAKAREKAQAKAAKGGAGSMLSAFFFFCLLSLSLFVLERYPLNYVPRIGNETPLGLTLHSLSSFSNIIATEANEAAKSIQCKVCMQAFVSTLSHSELKKHAENKHPKLDAKQCFPFLE